MVSHATKQSAQRIAEEIEESLERLQDDIGDTAHNAEDDLRKLAHDAGVKAREYIDGGEEKIVTAAQNGIEYIKSKPVQSSLAALAIGVCLGFLLRRRD